MKYSFDKKVFAERIKQARNKKGGVLIFR